MEVRLAKRLMLRSSQRHGGMPSIRRATKLAARSLAESQIVPFGRRLADKARTDSTVDSTSGAQKMACWSNLFCGSAAKRQPPLLSEVVRHRAGSFAGGQGHIVPLVPAIAAQPLPSYVRSFCFLGGRKGFLCFPACIRHRTTFPLCFYRVQGIAAREL